MKTYPRGIKATHNRTGILARRHPTGLRLPTFTAVTEAICDNGRQWRIQSHHLRGTLHQDFRQTYSRWAAKASHFFPGFCCLCSQTQNEKRTVKKRIRVRTHHLRKDITSLKIESYNRRFFLSSRSWTANPERRKIKSFILDR